MESFFAKLTTTRVAVAFVVLAAVGVVGGYGVAMRAQPKERRIALGSPAPRAPSDDVRRIYVHVAGAVRRPGLYRVADGARVQDAIRAGGGALEDADLDSLNLATKIRDGDKVLVPEEGAVADPGGGGAGLPGAPGGKINLNTATVDQLDSLPGIGPAIAQRIVSHREQHGGFRTVDDLQKVSGIGPAKFGSVKDLVTV